MNIDQHNLTQPSINIFATNHNVITTSYGRYFTSYDSVIVFLPNDSSTIYLGADWKQSPTTSKHRSRFLSYTTKELDSMLLDGRAVML